MTAKPLKKIIAEFLGSSDTGSDAFWRLYTLARRGIENEFSLDVTGGFETQLLDINPNKTLEIPAWCITVSKIGVINSIGEVVTLYTNDQLSTYHGIYYNETNRTEGVPLLNTFGTGDAVPTGAPYLFPYYYLNFFNAGTSFNLFGLPSGTAPIGFYKLDITNNVILINADFPFSQLLLEGLSSNFSEDHQDYMIDIRAAEAMIYWIRWQDMIDRPKKFSQSQAHQAMKMYYAEKRKAKVRLNTPNINQLQNAERKSWKLTPRA